MLDMAKRIAPSVVTCLGLTLTLAWLAGAPWWIGVIGLALDSCDGNLARRLRTTSEFGSLLDWTCDVVVSALVLVRLDLSWLLIALVPIQVWARRRYVRVSGRAALTLIAIVVRWLR